MINSITLLGTGTSQGVPMIGCQCQVCSSSDTKDKRLRTSAYIEYKGLKLIIDAGPDFRQQMLTQNIQNIDAILLTHQHKDHTGGLDDVRAFNYHTQKALPIYCEDYVFQSLKMEYAYAFAEKKYPGVPEYNIKIITPKPFTINDIEIVPFRIMHLGLPILGYRLGDLAYLTDGNYIPEESFDILKGIKILIINAVRRKKHISHFNLEEALEMAKRIGAKTTYITHISHQLGLHDEVSRELPENVYLGYDGVQVGF